MVPNPPRLNPGSSDLWINTHQKAEDRIRCTSWWIHKDFHTREVKAMSAQRSQYTQGKLSAILFREPLSASRPCSGIKKREVEMCMDRLTYWCFTVDLRWSLLLWPCYGFHSLLHLQPLAWVPNVCLVCHKDQEANNAGKLTPKQ